MLNCKYNQLKAKGKIAMNKITVQIKNVWGNKTIYPVCETALFFAKLAGTKTLTPDAVRVIKNQGYQIEVAPEVTSL